MKRFRLALPLVALLAMSALATADEPAKDRPPYDTIERYEKRRIEGWVVLVNRDLLDREHDALREQTLRVLAEHLFRVTRVVPAPALEKLRKIPIWVELNHPRHPCMCYHVSPDWLREHGMNPQKAKCVEIANAKNFLVWTIAQPWMVLHELAHGYHDQVLGYDNADVNRCYRQAVKAKNYDEVLHINGQKRRHYALTNAREYFAEASEAYFGTNDFYPFVRAELRQHDPAGYELMRKVWGK
jgi:hypothetical protein